ncbi:MAG TPA: DUF2330 domain-containing protein [Kofleriaceae bacterium]
MKRLALVAALLAIPSVADAFCGFYVAGSGDQLFNDATQVVLMRQGTRTVLAMQNHYQGPASEFAMIVPVPVVLQEADVKTLPDAVFDKVDQMGAPRLVEYWEIDPCFQERHYDEGKVAMSPTAEMAGAGSSVANAQGVTIEAKFDVGEYKILILSAKDSTGLDTWLRAEKYQIPKGAEPLLRPYVEQGMKFFVAKVDPQKVKFDGNKAMLSPLRFHYDSEEFALPIRLGLANSNGTQDLIVNILAPRQRYEVANYKNVTIPTNIDLSAKMKGKFPAFYTALFDRTIEKHPGAVITEYAWDASSCDPCPGPNLDFSDFATLGSDVLGGTREQPQPYQNGDFVLTRLHARYGKTITNDLVFKAVDPIAGGREHTIDEKGKLEEGSQPSTMNNFQARYAIRHLWTGPIACDAPVRGRWGGPPSGMNNQGPTPATKLAFAPRGGVDLPAVIKTDIPELGIKAASRTIATGGGFDPRPTVKKTGCGCAASDSGGLLFGGLVFAFAMRRRRPASRPSALEGQ